MVATINSYKLVRRVLNQEKLFRYNSLLAPIESLVFRVITIRAVSKFRSAYDLYLKNGKVPTNIASIIIQANFKSKGQVRRLALNNRAEQSRAEQVFTKKSSLFSQNEIELALEELKSFGFARIGMLKDSNLISELDKLSKAQVFSSLDFKSSGRLNIDLRNKPDQSYDHIWHVQPETALENIGLQEIILDSFWKQLADNYLSAPTQISALRCWHSFEHGSGGRLTPENWHLDAADGLNFIKFFVLLTDVNENSGPTSIVPIPSSQLPRKFYTGRRYTDEEVSKLLKSKNCSILNATGKKGMVYAADTRLLHRGTPVVKGHRFILNWTCSVDSFGTVENEKYILKPSNLLFGRKDLLDA
jgi:hypothetical protein